MKIKTKTILLSALILASIVSVFYLLTFSKSKQNAPSFAPPKPSLVQNYKGKFPITLSVDQNQFNFPAKLPILEFESSPSPLDETYVRNVAAKLAFSGEPTRIEDALDGTTYFWKNDTRTLFVYLKSRKIRYSTGPLTPGINKQLSDESIIASARDFIIDKGILSEDGFQTNSIVFLGQIPNGEGFRKTKKENAVLYLVDLLPKTSKYGFVSASSTDPASFVQLKQDGSVYSLQLTLFPPLKTGLTEYKLKNYGEVKSYLDSAVLIQLSGETALLADLPDNLIQGINIDQIEISYLMESPKATSFQPVYKLSGEAIIKSPDNKVPAILYLPAISEK